MAIDNYVSVVAKAHRNWTLPEHQNNCKEIKSNDDDQEDQEQRIMHKLYDNVALMKLPETFICCSSWDSYKMSKCEKWLFLMLWPSEDFNSYYIAASFIE